MTADKGFCEAELYRAMEEFVLADPAYHEARAEIEALAAEPTPFLQFKEAP